MYKITELDFKGLETLSKKYTKVLLLALILEAKGNLRSIPTWIYNYGDKRVPSVVIGKRKVTGNQESDDTNGNIVMDPMTRDLDIEGHLVARGSAMKSRTHHMISLFSRAHSYCYKCLPHEEEDENVLHAYALKLAMGSSRYLFDTKYTESDIYDSVIGTPTVVTNIILQYVGLGLCPIEFLNRMRQRMVVIRVCSALYWNNIATGAEDVISFVDKKVITIKGRRYDRESEAHMKNAMEAIEDEYCEGEGDPDLREHLLGKLLSRGAARKRKREEERPLLYK